METKTAIAKRHFKNGYIKKALKIFSSFRDATREQKIAYECMTGNERFYQQIGIDTDMMKQTAIEQIKTKYNL
ncbi:MAG: hypothetical protein II937_09685 [Bacteroidales bacterium]|nr:hypothetical protein [Bacteroidales bacterium]